MAVMSRLQREVMSGDVWFLAMSSAKEDLIELGVDEGIIADIFERLERVRRSARSRNPLSSMF
jgi:hypothetical protein